MLAHRTSGKAADKVMLLDDKTDINGAAVYWDFSRAPVGSNHTGV